MSCISLRNILDLPRVISSSIVSAWLTFRSVCLLDSVCCCKSVRQDFLEFLASAETVLVYKLLETEVRKAGFYMWLNLRKLKFSKLMVTDNTSTVELIRCLRISGAHINSVKLLGSNDDLFWTHMALLLNYCTNIRYVCFEDCEVTEILRDFLIKFSNLEEIFMNGCSLLSAETVEDLHCPALKSLSISDCSFTSKCVDALLALSDQLVNLKVSSKEAPTALTVTLLLRNSNLQRLVFRDSYFSERDLMRVVSNCEHLVALDLGNCEHATDAVILAAVMHCPHLLDLLIDDDTKVTEASLLAIASRCPLLNSINLSEIGALSTADCVASCTHLTTCYLGISTEQEVKRLPASLTTLIIIEEVCDDVLVAVAEHCTRQQHLRITSYRRCTATGLAALARGCPALRTLEVPQHEKLFTPAVLQLWEVARPQVQLVRTSKLWSQDLFFAPDIAGYV